MERAHCTNPDSQPPGIASSWLALLGEILDRLNHDGPVERQLADIIDRLQRFLGCDAVAIRRFDGADYPYLVRRGLDPRFVGEENLICSDGEPECLCGRVLTGQTDPARSYFTAGGSFISSDTAEVARELAADTSLTVRATCLRAGFRTLALVPIRAANEIIGLLQVAYRSCNRLSGTDVEQLEGLCNSLGLALARRQADAALEHSRSSARRLGRALERLFNQANSFVCITRLNGTIQRANPALLELIGRDTEALQQTRLDQLVHPDDRAVARGALDRLACGEPVNALRCRIVDQTGSVRTLEWSATADGEEELIYALAIDVSERTILEAQLRQRDSMEAIGQLTAGVAHDFNNQLLAILGYAELLELRVANADLRRYARSIRDAARHSSHLTEQLLAFAQQSPSRPQPLSIHALIEEMAALIRRSIDRRITIQLDLAAAPDTVDADRKQLSNGILNMMLNARDAMPNGGVMKIATRNRQIDPATAGSTGQQLSTGGYLEITVSDSGTGMTPEVASRIFEPFFTTKPLGHSSGLGLAALHGTVSQLGGTVDVWSRPGEGSRFTVLLPESATQGSAAQEIHNEPSQLRVLVVDDEELVRDIAGDMLTAIGHRPQVAVDGADAIRQLELAPEGFDLIVLDLVMPKMSGAETFERLRAIRPDVPILLCSGYTRNEQISSLIDRGAAGFIQKPFDSRDLGHAIADALPASVSNAR